VDPLITAIATAAAGKLAEETARGIVAASKYVRDYFSNRAEQEVVLLRAETGRGTIEDLAETISSACAMDAGFHQQLTQLAGQPIAITQVNQEQQHVRFQNNFYNGGPDKVFQADTINFQNPH
jgi:DNA-binding GntR family transcriptional regulator